MMMVTIHDGNRTFTGLPNSDAETLHDVVLRVIANAIVARKMAR